MTAASGAGLPILYSFRRCPYAMRARLALLASGQACELREVVLRDKPQALRDASPKATVPVLALQDGTVIDQSLDIMLWALRRHDPLGWLVPSEGDLAQMLALVADNDTQFKPLLDRYKYPQRHQEPDGTRAREAARPFIDGLQHRLAAAPFLFGRHATLADMALAPFLRQFAAVAPDWFAAQPWPAVQAWLRDWQASALFERAMPRFAPWQVGDAPLLFSAATHA
ncbi:glutathione S-transferase [Pseudorhodoferax sp. Leaf267]|uniref:glutathione S-transferase n=1 Tax=Pseudorhodoferax sp. Leaf267 TaxID=1736316 RepID=UPI0006F5A7AB|nr:glutathione S-transferase [Pseudorhodoferax sp. Leaf267]KQP14978.1 glutathione S-transferase [Pseudorhodoferax sp. Leaf267]